jgi:hypothetical protein
MANTNSNPGGQIDETLAQEFLNHAADLKSDYSTRNSNLDKIEAMYMLDWQTGKPDDPAVQATITVDPDPRNSTIGAVRLMTAAEPSFSVPFDENIPDAGEKSDKVEQWCLALWRAAGKIRQRPLHQDAVLSAVLFNEVHLAINSTQDLLSYAQKQAPNDPRGESAIKRFQRIAETTPFMLELLGVREGYPEYDNYGLAAYYREVTMRAGEILDKWGDLAILGGLSNSDRKNQVTYGDWWDDTYHAVYINSKCILLAPHGMPCIPIVAQVVEGSNELFSKAEYRSQPFLYALQKSGMWERENLSLTVMYNAIFRIGASVNFVYKRATGNEEALTPNFDILGGVIEIKAGEDYVYLQRQVVDPAVQNGLGIAERKSSEATMYKQALGEPLGANAPFSSVSLLNQAGRLPLVPMQKSCQSAFGKAMEICLTLAKAGIGGTKVATGKGPLELKTTDIPDGISIDCKVEIDLPQDDRQNALVAMQLTSGDAPMASKRWVRENLLHMGQSNLMDKEIAREKYINAQIMAYYQQMMAQLQQQTQPMGGPAGVPGGPGGPGGAGNPGSGEQVGVPGGVDQGAAAGQGIPPELMAQMAGGGAGQAGLPGMPMTEPVQGAGQ